jgi:hypothetical protein
MEWIDALTSGKRLSLVLSRSSIEQGHLFEALVPVHHDIRQHLENSANIGRTESIRSLWRFMEKSKLVAIENVMATGRHPRATNKGAINSSARSWATRQWIASGQTGW